MNNPMHWQNSLLALNPWARQLWSRRRELVQRALRPLFELPVDIAMAERDEDVVSEWRADEGHL
jgi:hypothetical protein